MKKFLTFDDVLIVPKFSTINSRKDLNLSSCTHLKTFHDIGCDFPIISANMDTVTEHTMARAMLSYGAQACLHRFCSIEDNVDMFRLSEVETDEDCTYRPMVSIGLGEEGLVRASALYANNATIFIIDVAHGAQMAVVNQVKALRGIVKDNAAIIVGNFATGDSIREFLQHLSGPVEGFKVGIGPGSACTTRIKTGVGIPQLGAIMDSVEALKKTGIPVIADGGLKTPGDIAKALGAGAHMVMVGGMLAGTQETPGEVNYGLNMLTGEMDPVSKKYRGSASKESYEDQGKDTKWRTAEGDSFYVPYKGPVSEVLQDIEGGLRSAFSYTDSRNLQQFHERCEFAKVTSATVRENGSHGKKE